MQTPPPTKAACEVLAERQRQIDVEGYDAKHDSDHTPEQFVWAAIAYAMLSMQHPDKNGDRSLGLNSGGEDIRWTEHARLLWPWPGGPKPKGQRRDLIRAAALILAALDRMDADDASPK